MQCEQCDNHCYFLSFLLECAQSSDCPNKGENYKCVSNFCTCESGHYLDGDACVGMLPIWYFRYLNLCLLCTVQSWKFAYLWLLNENCILCVHFERAAKPVLNMLPTSLT